MPQMGESIAEGTVSKWLKQIGDVVERDEPILEISTDKVDAEIPSPTAGTLVHIEVAEGETVEVGTVVAYIETELSVPGDGRPEKPASSEPSPAEVPSPEGAAPLTSTATAPPPPAEADLEERLRTRSTPVVRKIAAEHGIDITKLEGSGHAGRVTKQDILTFIDSGRDEHEEVESVPAVGLAPEQKTDTSAPAGDFDMWGAFYGQVQHPQFPVREADTVEPMDKIRRLTAEHMVLAKRVAPHVHSLIEIDFTRVARIRRENKARWAEQGVGASFTAFVVWACARLLAEFPNVNATVSGNNILRRGNVNVGIAVDLDPGLIVPVIRDAGDLSLLGIGRKIIDLAERARARRLNPDEIQGATFTVTNPGVLGTLVGMPIIPKGTAAILGTGAITKRPVVVEDPLTGGDVIAIRPRAIFSLGYDHRLVDGAEAARFLAKLRDVLEHLPDDA